MNILVRYTVRILSSCGSFADVETIFEPGMQPFLKKQTGVVYARVGGHAFWPARVCDLPEYLHMVPHRQKTQQVCVYFFGAKNLYVVDCSAFLHRPLILF